MNVKVKMLRAMPVVGGNVEVGIVKVNKTALDEVLSSADDSSLVHIDYVSDSGIASLKLSFDGKERTVRGVIREKKD
jgi:hypothetical protein